MKTATCKRTRRLVGALLGGAIAAAAGSARAGSEGFCRQYAADGIADQQRNLAMGCGFSGPSWSADANGHYPWCIGAREESANQQRDARREWLAKCQRCNAYADGAMAAIARAGGRCSLGGGRWEPNRAGHFGWCMGAQAGTVDREERFRNYDADKCVRCSTYAAAAVRAQADNRARGCGFTGPEWQDGVDGHFHWCWNLDSGHQGVPVSETARRDALLRSCPSAETRRRCETYADRAVSQYDAMRRQSSCNESGPAWHGNRADHYNWCLAVPATEAVAHERARDDKLASCHVAAPPSTEQCKVSITIRNRQCTNATDGSPSSRTPGELSDVGCGETREQALQRAIANFARDHEQCLTAGDTPARGCCTFEYTPSDGCLCPTLSTRGRRTILREPAYRVRQRVIRSYHP